MGSSSITFRPTVFPKGGEFKCGSKSASSTGLMFQCLLPILCFAQEPVKLILQGGTTVSKSPPSTSIENILLKLLHRMGLNIEQRVIRHGYYPAGNGTVEVKILPSKLKAIQLLERTEIDVIHFTFLLTKELAFKEYIKDILGPYENQQKKINVAIKDYRIVAKKFKQCYGVVVNVVGEGCYFDFSHICQADETLEQVMDTVYKKVQQEQTFDSCLDEHHQDQLLIFMSLAQGESAIKVGPHLTEHTNGALYAIKKFIPDLQVEIQPAENHNIIKIKGIDYVF